MGIEIFRLKRLGKIVLASATIAASLVSAGGAAYDSMEPERSGNVSSEDCVEWDGRKDEDGYGRINRGELAHRSAWEKEFGPIPEGAVVGHRCDNPPCVAVWHLFLATQKENMRDRTAKGRQAEQKRTHCPRGHALEGSNLRPYALKRGERDCLTCHKARRLARYAEPEYNAWINARRREKRRLARIAEVSSSATSGEFDRGNCLR